ncbi:hypothetical protein OG352_35145 [Streptomyces sp. NBC_01485]|uniref:hypothetical protein n=1 Tax=Streptomyces sp. NBC_01485 TaxID=2903884 RepID=UPI002E371E30|nr:hypothetical protein [Streptomyces sp. NBC_01485]
MYEERGMRHGGSDGFGGGDTDEVLGSTGALRKSSQYVTCGRGVMGLAAEV